MNLLSDFPEPPENFKFSSPLILLSRKKLNNVCRRCDDTKFHVMPEGEDGARKRGSEKIERSENPHKTTKQLSSTNLIFSHRNNFALRFYRICLIFCHRIGKHEQHELSSCSTPLSFYIKMPFQFSPAPLRSRHFISPFIMWRMVGKTFTLPQ